MKLLTRSISPGRSSLGWPVAAKVKYLLRDDFNDTRAAGAVNGTPATPGSGTRAVVDTENKISVGSGVLNFASGKAAPAWADPGYYLDDITRVAGKILITKITVADMSSAMELGFDDAAPAGQVSVHSFRINGDTLLARSSSAGPVVLVPVDGTAYTLAIVLRSSGAYFFAKGGTLTYWTLLHHASTRNDSPISTCLINNSAAFTADFFRIPVNTFLPIPLAYDTFNRGDGVLGNSETVGPDNQCTPALAWSAKTGTIQVSGTKAIATALTGGKAIATVPTGSADVVADIALTRGTATAGLVLRYVDADNYLYVVHNGANLQFYKRVAGVETSLVDAAAAYAIGAPIRIALYGTSAEVFYNNVKIGATQIVPASASGNHGLYFTDTDSTLDSLLVFSRGTSGEYNVLAKYAK